MALKYKVIRCVAYTIEIILLFILQELPYLMPPAGSAAPFAHRRPYDHRYFGK